MQVNEKIFEVEQIVCRRQHNGREEFLVYWKGFDISSATWEPVDNLLSCTDLIEQFQRQSCPIPGANPYNLVRAEKSKTVHRKMLLNRKKNKRSKSVAGLDDSLVVNNENLLDKPITVVKKKCLDGSEKIIRKKSLTESEKIIRKKSLTESEKLIRDTLLHESKTMVPKMNKLNGILNCFDNNSPIKLNGVLNGNSIKRSINRTNRMSEGKVANDEQLVQCIIKKNYMQVTLNNTARHNLLTNGMIDALSDYLQKAKRQSDVKAVLLTNNGDQFCSGIDYTELMRCTDEKEYKTLVHSLIFSLRHFLSVLQSFSKPLVCAVNGPAMEFGVALVIAADFAYSTSKASFDLIYNKLCLTPIGCLTQLLPRAFGNSMANSMLSIGGRYSAKFASDRGLVLEMYGINSFDEDMEKKMSQLTANSGPILEATKKLVKHFDHTRLEEVCNEELRVYQQCLFSKDFRKKLTDDWTMLINLYSDF